MTKFRNTMDNFHPLKHPTWRLPPTHKSLHASGRVVGETSGNDDFVQKKSPAFFRFLSFLDMEISLAKTFGKSSASAKDANFLTLPFFRKG